jgi:hypothetical protein
LGDRESRRRFTRKCLVGQGRARLCSVPDGPVPHCNPACAGQREQRKPALTGNLSRPAARGEGAYDSEHARQRDHPEHGRHLGRGERVPGGRASRQRRSGQRRAGQEEAQAHRLRGGHAEGQARTRPGQKRRFDDHERLARQARFDSDVVAGLADGRGASTVLRRHRSVPLGDAGDRNRRLRDRQEPDRLRRRRTRRRQPRDHTTASELTRRRPRARHVRRRHRCRQRPELRRCGPGREARLIGRHGRQRHGPHERRDRSGSMDLRPQESVQHPGRQLLAALHGSEQLHRGSAATRTDRAA